jgi:hypothetical protein
MGGGGSKEDDKPLEKVQKDSKDDCSKGPVEKRSCTDVLWCLLFLAHVGLFWFLGLQAVTDPTADPVRLTNGRDFMGNVCGAKNSPNIYGKDLEAFPVVYYALNITAVQEKMAKNLFPAAYAETTASAFNPVELAQRAQAMSATEALSQMVGPPDTLISQLTSYFHPVCVKSCTIGMDDAGQSTLDRAAMWEGQLFGKTAWTDTWVRTWKVAAIQASQNTAFREDECPYPAKFCASINSFAPDVQVAQLGTHCVPTIQTGIDLASAVSDVGTMIPANFSAAAGNIYEQTVSDVVNAWYTFIIMGIVGLVIGIIYLVLMRMVIKILVWTSLLLIGVILLGGAFLLYLKQTICVGTQFEDSLVSFAGRVANETTGVAAV